MAIFSATLSSFTSISFLSPSHSQQQQPGPSSFSLPKSPHNKLTPWQWHHHYRHTPKIIVSGNTQINENHEDQLLQRSSAPDPQDDLRQARLTSSDWKAAKAYIDSGFLYNGRIKGFNDGGLLVRFHSIMGFLPYRQLSPVHSCKEPEKTIQEIAKDLLGSMISVKVIIADEEKKTLVLSEKEAAWTKFSNQVNIGDVFEGRVSNVEDYGAFVHLRFPDGLYHLTGLLHLSEVSWDLVLDVRDFLAEGDQVRVKVISIDREKSTIGLSMRQLEEDPLLETLDKVIPQGGSADPDSLNGSNSSGIEPLPGLGTILEELLQEKLIEKRNPDPIELDEVEEIQIDTRKRGRVDHRQPNISNIFKRSLTPQSTLNNAFKQKDKLILDKQGIAAYGNGYEPPSYHDIRERLLKEKVEDTNVIKEEHRVYWKKFGCTIMTDGWTDQRKRTLLNFCVHSPRGTFFLKSIDASGFSKTADKILEILEDVIDEVGVENVVQIVTDNAANYKLAGQMLMEKKPYIYWTPCAAHCIDLMLEDFES